MGYSSAAMELGTGRIVHGWRIEEPLGRGAMAVVYRVRHTELGTLAALKVLDRVDPTTEHRLLQEGRAQGSIHHPGIVSVLDFVRVDGHAALLLEYVPGSDLAALLARRWLSLDEALDLFRQVVSAVAAAHAAGLVHRDLKPSNVLVTETSRGLVAKVGDFGLVKSESADLTATHALVGTPKYMAPEQMRAARKVDARADLFALGCVLYELVCGRPAFPGDDLVELYTAKNAGHYASPSRLVPDLPRPVVVAIGACLEGAVARRIPSCGTLLAVLGGAPWSASAGADETLDVDLGGSVCPACGAAVPAERCPACGADPNLAQRYRLVDLLSAGVWRSLDLREGRWIVARMLRDTDRERFDRGARVARELQHPQIARGLEPPFDEHGRRWEIRELVEGTSLADVLATHRFSEAEVLEVVQELVAPLRYLADRSPPVVHRALSPSHVIRATDGRLVLIDFAQVRDVRGDGSLHDRPDGAPELWVGEATPASDVYGLGALAVTLLTRRPAHELRVVDRIAFEDHVTASDGTKALLRAMVSPVPTERPSIGEVARRAGALAAELRRPASPVVRPSGSARQAVTALVAAAAMSTLLIMAGVGYIVAREPAATQAPLPDEPSPNRILEPGADLADRPVPGGDCGTPFDQAIRVVGWHPKGTRVPLLFVSGCDGSVRPLGEFELGVEAVAHLPGAGTVRVPWGRSSCGPEPAPPCDAFRLEGPREPLDVRLTVGQNHVLVKTGDNTPLPGAELVFDDGDALPAPTLVSDGGGVVAFPWGDDDHFSVVIDGVNRRAHYMPWERVIEVVSSEETSEVVVVDQAGQPIPSAHVVCRAGRDRRMIPSAGITGATGSLRCDTGAAADRWAEVSAAGYVTTETQLLQPTVRVTLAPARTVHVGCAGLAGGLCTTIQSPVACAGADDGPSGTCRFVGSMMVCGCALGADRIVHGILGTLDLPPDRTDVWFDLRTLGGRVEGQLPEPPKGERLCELRLSTSKGILRTPIDDDGRFSLTGVPRGSYRAETLCPWSASWENPEVKVGDGPVQLTLVKTSEAPDPKPDPPRPPDVTPRELVDYTFPVQPAGTDPEEDVSCQATVGIAADGAATDVKAHDCAEGLRTLAEAAVRTWRWEAGPADTTEELRVPFRTAPDQ